MDSNAYEVFSLSDLAVVSSGTATLEAGLIGIPQVVCYKVNTISYHIARKLVGLKYISLVNLIMDKAVVPELIQKDCNASSITTSLKEIESNRDSIMKDYGNLREKIGTGGASKRAAEIIVSSSSTSSSHY